MPLTDVTVRYLALDRAAFAPKRTARANVLFARVDPPMPELNRFFYRTVGREYYWLDRRAWTVAQWTAQVARGDAVETWILSVDGVPAGYTELERGDGGVVDIAYFGMLRAYAGQGLGAHMLTCAIERAVAMGATTVTVNTCSLDHATALSNYVARGFREVRSEVQRRDLPPAPPIEGDVSRELLRHGLAVVAYRGAKALRGAPDTFAQFAARPGTRTPIGIVAHLGDLYDWALSMAVGAETWRDTTPSNWDADVARFFASLRALDNCLASDARIAVPAERLLAGPVADSLAHIGQLAMLRRMAGAPIKGENYSRAEIVTGRIGLDQAAPTREFD